MDEWMIVNRWRNEWMIVNGWMNEGINKCMNKVWMKVWINEGINECMKNDRRN